MNGTGALTPPTRLTFCARPPTAGGRSKRAPDNSQGPPGKKAARTVPMSDISSPKRTDPRRPLTLLLAAPRGFAPASTAPSASSSSRSRSSARRSMCATRSCTTASWSTALKAMGAVFIDELDEAPDGARVIFSGPWRAQIGPGRGEAPQPVPPRRHLPAGLQGPRRSRAAFRGRAHHCSRSAMPAIPKWSAPWASCRRRDHSGRDGVEDAEKVRSRDAGKLAYITQTTLSVDDTAEIVAVLKRRFPDHRRPAQGRHLLRHHQPPGRDQGDRAARRRRAGDRSPNSSNSMRLVEVARRAGRANRRLIQRRRPISIGRARGRSTVGLSAGASAPEVLVEEVIAAFRARYDAHVEEVAGHARRRGIQTAARAGGLEARMAVYTDVSFEELEVFPRRLRSRRAACLQGHRRGRREFQLLSANGARAFHRHALRKARARGRPAVLPRPDGASGERGIACPTPIKAKTGALSGTERAATPRS